MSSSIIKFPMRGGQALSPREREILRLLMQGAEIKEIAVEQGIQEIAVKEHIKAVLQRLRTRTLSAPAQDNVPDDRQKTKDAKPSLRPVLPHRT